jgi:hypothetical protein
MRIDAPIITGSFSLNGSTLGSLASVATTGSNTFLGGQSATSFAGDQLTANDRAYLRRIDGIAGTTIEVIAPISASAGITGSTNFDTIVNKPTLVSGSSQVIDILSSLNTATASFTPRISNLESKSSSVDISISNINNFTASNGNESLNSKTGSYATTGSNTFFGTQTYSGSVYIANDLIVQGSSSIQYISASSVSIGTNIVQLNTANPSVRFAGLSIIDSGSVGGSGSFLYDSVQDEFIFVHRGNGTNITSSHFVLGPETYDSLGNETYLTNNTLPKGTGKEHLVDSNITDSGTLITLGSNTTITGTLVASGTTLVSSSAQVIGILSSLNTYTGSNDTTNTTQNTRLTTIESVTGSYETKGRSIVSGSSQITLTSTTGYSSVLNQAVLTTSSPTFAVITITGNMTARNFNKYVRSWSSNGSYVWSEQLDAISSSFDNAGWYKGFIREANGAHYRGYYFDILVGQKGYGGLSSQYRVFNIIQADSPYVGGCGSSAFAAIDNSGFTKQSNPCGDDLLLYITKLSG